MMMVRFLRSGKWELVAMFIISAAVSSMLAALLWMTFTGDVLTGNLKLLSGLVLFLVSGAFGYWSAKRISRRLDVFHIALKQAVNGNYDTPITEEGFNSFSPIYREFNVLISDMKGKMKLLQQLGEEKVLRESASNEMAVLEERKRLARDLHDTVSQQLFAIHMCASSLPKLQAANSVQAEEVLQQLIEMSNLAQKQMRNFIAQLRPMELEDRTLQEALDKWFPDFCRQNQIQGILEWRLSEQLSEGKEHQLFLITQEAMANVVKHAKASTCTLTLSATERQVVLMLTDDGVGFKADQIKSGSYGLSTMQERAEKLGGTADIVSKIGSGTRVKVVIPKLDQGEPHS